MGDARNGQVSPSNVCPLDLRDYDLPFFNEDEGPRGNDNRRPAENVTRWLADIASADGYVFITPEYNEGPSAALKNAIDFLAFEATRKPAAIIGYSNGSNGGMYAPIQLRVTLGEVGMIALKTQQIILNADKVLDQEGVPTVEDQPILERRFESFMDNLLWFTEVLKVGREKA